VALVTRRRSCGVRAFCLMVNGDSRNRSWVFCVQQAPLFDHAGRVGAAMSLMRRLFDATRSCRKGCSFVSDGASLSFWPAVLSSNRRNATRRPQTAQIPISATRHSPTYHQQRTANSKSTPKIHLRARRVRSCTRVRRLRPPTPQAAPPAIGAASRTRARATTDQGGGRCRSAAFGASGGGGGARASRSKQRAATPAAAAAAAPRWTCTTSSGGTPRGTRAAATCAES